MTVDQRPDQPDAGQGAESEHQQHQFSVCSHAQRCQERRDIDVENVVRQDERQHREQHRAHAGQQEYAPQRQLPAPGLSRKVRHTQTHPDHQDQGQPAHDSKACAPAPQRAQERAGRNAQRQRQRRTQHRHRDRAPLLMCGHHARGVTGQQRPQQSRRHAGQEARGQGQHIAG
jgi:hypothetical protein